MKTYQDLLGAGQSAEELMSFVKDAINEHKGSELYSIAKLADEYDRMQNRTITQYRRMLYKLTGEAVPDYISANYKLPSKFFNRFTTQQVQFLLGNGIEWDSDSVKNKLGGDFDIRLQEIAKASLLGGVAFGFFNADHLIVFSLLEFVPLYDEESGALRAGIRFWQIEEGKPLRATLFQEDGTTEYAWIHNDGEVIVPKTPYKLKIQESVVDGRVIYDGENYPTFPIVPLWANPQKQSEIIGIREQIDAYDLIKSGFANDLDEAAQIYWTIKNAGGMDDIDLVKFVERMKTVKAAVVDDQGSTAEAHTQEVPYAAREAILERLEKDLYKDYMAFNPESVSAGATTATQIKAAYEPINSKADQFEYCIHEFIKGILDVAGLEAEATFTRSVIINVQEEIQTIIQAAMYLDEDYVTRKILAILGDADMADELLKKKDEEEMKMQVEKPLVMPQPETVEEGMIDVGQRDEANR